MINLVLKRAGLTYDFGDGKMYFFTRFLSREIDVYRHVAGGGFWKRKKETSYVIGEYEKPIAAKTTLVYYHKNKNSTPVKTQWRMKEYKLLDNNQRSEQIKEDNKTVR